MLNKIKKIFIIIMFLITCFFVGNFGLVNAATNSEHEVIINTGNVVEGVKEPIEYFIARKVIEMMIPAIILILAIILIVGLIMFLNKKFSSKVRKTGVALIIAAIFIALIILIVALATNQTGILLWVKIFNVLKILIVPIILIIGLIGLIMYFNKKTSDRVKKIGLALIIMAAVLAVIALAIYIWSQTYYDYDDIIMRDI